MWKKKTVIIGLAIIMLLLCSCDGLVNKNSIEAIDSITKERLSIKMDVERATITEPMYFSVDEEIEELAGKVKETDSSLDPSLMVEVYQDRFIFIRKDAKIFLIEQIEETDTSNGGENRYCFFAPVGTFKSDIQEDCLDSYVDMHIPYYLLKGITVQHGPDSENAYPPIMEYEVSGSMDEIVEFYEALEAYDIETNDADITVTNGNIKYKMMLTFSDNEEGFPTVQFSILDK